MPYFGVPIRNGVPIGLGSIAGFGISPFDPSQLFAGGEQGGWYDPSDLSTLYQDAAGTTPVTAVEQPVGLVLDKSKGLVLGSQLFTNADFDNSTTGWTASGGSTFTVSSGRANWSSASGSVFFFQNVSAATNKYYEMTVNVVSVTGTVRLVVNGGLGATSAPLTTGVTTVRLQNSSANGNAGLQADTAFSIVVESISIRELPGSHLSQSTAAARPVLSARVNLLTYTEQFDNAAWTKTALSAAITAATTDPLGGTTARICTLSGGATTHVVSQAALSNVASGVTYALSVYAKAGTWQYVRLGRQNNIFPAPGTWWWDLSNGSFNGTLSAGWANQSITPVGNGWYRLSVQVTAGSTGSDGLGVVATDNAGGTSPNSDGSTFYIWGADLRPANAGVGLPSYQRVGASTDYDATGFPLYLKFDGTDDFLVSGTINPGSVDKAQVFAGVRKVSGASQGMMLEFSTAVASNAGSLNVQAPGSTGDNYDVRSKGDAAVAAGATGNVTAPSTRVLTMLSDIAGDSLDLRLDSTSVSTSSADQGLGNFNSYPLYVGRRAGSTFPFNGQLYSLILRFSATNLDAATIASTETWVNSKTGAY